jgi:hypothetical protein
MLENFFSCCGFSESGYVQLFLIQSCVKTISGLHLEENALAPDSVSAIRPFLAICADGGVPDAGWR